jgi:hypothetical protein
VFDCSKSSTAAIFKNCGLGGGVGRSGTARVRFIRVFDTSESCTATILRSCNMDEGIGECSCRARSIPGVAEAQRELGRCGRWRSISTAVFWILSHAAEASSQHGVSAQSGYFCLFMRNLVGWRCVRMFLGEMGRGWKCGRLAREGTGSLFKMKGIGGF